MSIWAAARSVALTKGRISIKISYTMFGFWHREVSKLFEADVDKSGAVRWLAR
jgi:hypothetical protein